MRPPPIARLAPLSSRKACSISRSSMAALRCKGKAPAGASVWSWRQALSTRMPAAEMSTHLKGRLTTGSVEQPHACSISPLSTGALETKPSTHLAAACNLSPRTLEQPQSLLDQSELHGGSPLQRQSTILHVQVRGPGSKHSPPECQLQRRARTLRLLRVAHRGAATKLPRSVGAP